MLRLPSTLVLYYGLACHDPTGSADHYDTTEYISNLKIMLCRLALVYGSLVIYMKD
jgi:hypothetical protein